MKINSKNNLRALVVVLGILFTPLAAFAFDSDHHDHGIEVETVDSNEAYPTKIHAQITDNGVEIDGTLKRKGHKNRRLHGTIMVALVSKKGTVLETKALKIKNKSGSAKHDHYRKFSTTMMIPKTKGFSIRIRHAPGKSESE